MCSIWQKLGSSNPDDPNSIQVIRCHSEAAATDATVLIRRVGNANLDGQFLLDLQMSYPFPRTVYGAHVTLVHPGHWWIFESDVWSKEKDRFELITRDTGDDQKAELNFYGVQETPAGDSFLVGPIICEMNSG